jgi:ATP-binding cassette subfamily B protein
MQEETIKIKNKAKSLDNFKKLGRNFLYFIKLGFKCSPYVFSFYFILSIIASIFPVITSKYFGNLIDSLTGFIKNGDTGNVWSSLTIYAVIFITPNILQVITDYFDNVFYLKFINFIDIFTLKKRGALDIAHVEDPKFQDLIQQAFNQGWGPVVDLIDVGIVAIRRFFIVVISSTVLFAIDWRIFLCVVVLSLPKLFTEIKFGGLNWSIYQENSREQRVFQTLRMFFINKFSIIESKFFQIQDFFIKKAAKILDDFSDKRVYLEKNKAKYNLLTEILSTGGMFLGLSIAISGALKGSISVGTVVFLFSIISAFNMNITNLLVNIARLLERNLYVSDIMEVINKKPIIKEISNPEKISDESTPEIEFKNVSFKYPGQNNYVLKNISFYLKPGEKLGLVGHNGAGKTTIIRLLLRIHDPSEGQILVNGINLKDVGIKDWWSKLSVLPQDFTSFNFEAKHAISYGDVNKEFDIEKVRVAAKQSTASEFIEKWDDQYERMIGVEFGGAELSKGERQKMALSRVFYRNSSIFVLDEPTAAIDSKSTSEIFRNIEAISDKQSMLIISHNFATLRRANKIIFLDNGEIIEEGSHDELMKAKKTYSELYEQQKGEYE